MFRVMLIDDDVPMLKVLRQMIDWEAHHLQIVGSTYSSAKALHMFEEVQPDIVITDIGLPQTNGIELADRFISMKPDIRVIFLTCHEDFQYAQQAVKLKADDYLIKDQLTAEQLAQSLGKSVRLLKSRVGLINRETARCNSILFRKDLLQRVIDGAPSETTVAYAGQIGISWTYPWFMLGIVSIHFSSFDNRYKQSEYPLILYAIYNIALELSESSEGITPFLEQENIVIMYNFRVNLAQNANLHLHNYLQQLRFKCSHFLKIQPSVIKVTDKVELDTIGPVFQKMVQDKCEFYENTDYIDSDTLHITSQMFQPAPKGFLDGYVSELERAVIRDDLEGISGILQEIIRIAREMSIIPDDFVRELSSMLRGIELIFSSLKFDEDLFAYLALTRTLEDTMELVERKFMLAMKSRHKGAVTTVQEPKLQVIQQFIDQHLADNITSIDMARYLFLNPSYFSRYFKRMTGLTFTDYVHQYKMKVATNMMKMSNQNLESLAVGLGYSDRTYFSKVFKKYVGSTPSEYKARHLARK
ncbi:two-component system, response regulator YesN [Paenibacillus uliginis N3/975]|uniref:Two-component system, response regulator YesN n=1 Tax=Paenibacillus uliginis N3/975 TaxID=1313296 RepID=A0A1X7HR45_9BACL|nr:response regulator [Paenibacillus uliginis]SMF90838.1 two-component system, response regulator YesN [Paenibacillus uliginis N3/975]